MKVVLLSPRSGSALSAKCRSQRCECVGYGLFPGDTMARTVKVAACDRAKFVCRPRLRFGGRIISHNGQNRQKAETSSSTWLLIGREYGQRVGATRDGVGRHVQPHGQYTTAIAIHHSPPALCGRRWVGTVLIGRESPPQVTSNVQVWVAPDPPLQQTETSLSQQNRTCNL